MPVSPDDAPVDRPIANSDSAKADPEETAAKAQAGTLPQEADVPQFASSSTPGDLGRLGKYRIQRELGRGGMGAVYLAFDERLQRKVALKVMLPKAASNATARERFLREARAAAQISSDNVVNIFEADELDGTPYIALQFLQGYPLDQYLKKKGNPTIPQIIRVGMETALGLAKAHKLGLVHRDIKPGNLWLEAPTGRVKILDFGLAKPLIGAEGAELTGSGAVMGTPAYMAPEQGMGKAVDGRSDLFSLGCVLYRLCTGKLPFERPTLMAILTAIATEDPIPIHELNPNVPQALVDLIGRLMAKKPDKRPASASITAKELEQIAAALKGGSRPEVSLSQPQVEDVPMAISVQEANPFADIDEPTDDETPDEERSELSSGYRARQQRKKFPMVLVGSIAAGLLVVLLAAGAIIKFAGGKKGTTESTAPETAKNEKTIPQLPAAFKNSLGMEFVKVPKGSAWLGGSNGKPGDVKMDLPYDFYLGKFEVTQAEWEK
ncbi:MAG TPA: protein kinase, partial [Urbifossiella sp.]